MATQLQMRRGTASQNSSFTGAEGEVSVNTTNDSLHIHDGSTAGGFELARVDGSNWANITTTANIDVGTVTADGLTVDGVSKLKAGSTSTPANTAAFISNASAKIVVNHGNEYGAYVGYANSSNDAIGIQSTTSGGTTAPLSLNPYGGNVGIGTASPYGALTLDTANGILNIANGNTSGGTKIQAWGATPTNGYLAIEGYDKEYMRIDSSGNVGIGTSSPDEQMHLHGGSSATRLRISGGALNETYGGFIEGEGVSGQGGHLRLGVVDNGTDRVAIEIEEQGNQIVFDTAGSEAMRIDSSGNVGINVSSSLDQKLNMADTADVGIKMTKTGSITTTMRAVGGALAFGVDGGAGTTERMRINSSGNVGVGTSSPDSLLTIDKNVSTAYSSTDDSAQRSNTNTLLLKNEDGTANSFAQIAFEYQKRSNAA
jgi:hypothetical protein